ncbi:hypothetical protein CBR_g19831 [Chara braunii]|uniref:Uncharacterized protein n=1 Tax=Chara braunii TaxID=69332 RepID=A0A388JU13_CHABU|nr:hypothetical protein CBR_g19831 [Chara braunii]|eukprot:GBG61298.1 hypothetical protein CBR_g19831 [Chara braunii]
MTGAKMAGAEVSGRRGGGSVDRRWAEVGGGGRRWAGGAKVGGGGRRWAEVGEGGRRWAEPGGGDRDWDREAEAEAEVANLPCGELSAWRSWHVGGGGGELATWRSCHVAILSRGRKRWRACRVANLPRGGKRKPRRRWTEVGRWSEGGRRLAEMCGGGRRGSGSGSGSGSGGGELAAWQTCHVASWRMGGGGGSRSAERTQWEW